MSLLRVEAIGRTLICSLLFCQPAKGQDQFADQGGGGMKRTRKMRHLKYELRSQACHPRRSFPLSEPTTVALKAAFCCLLIFASPIGSIRKLVGAVEIELTIEAWEVRMQPSGGER